MFADRCGGIGLAKGSLSVVVLSYFAIMRWGSGDGEFERVCCRLKMLQVEIRSFEDASTFVSLVEVT
jgi:hypothetical protein